MANYKRGSKPVEPKKQKGPKSNPTVELTTSGADMLDLALGGGAPWGKIINIVGDNSSGKTLLTCELISEAVKKYGDELDWFYDDAESGFSFDSNEIWGIDIQEEDPETLSNTAEDLITNVRKFIKPYFGSNKKLIYVVDSLDGLTDDAELDHIENREKAKEKGEKSNGTYGATKPKLMSQFFRTVEKDLKKTNCLLIVISQLRDNIGVSYGKKSKRSGGRALDFYAAWVVWLKTVEKIEPTIAGHKRKTGVTIQAEVTKNKIGKPYRKCEFKILFDYGVDNIDSNLCFLFDLITETGKTKKQINVEWDNEKFTDRAKLISYIEENDQEEMLLEKVKEKWYSIEDSFKPNRKRK